MCNIVISDREWGLLAGEPSDYLKLYIVVKRRMDFATGIAGEKTLINETVLREGFTVDPVQGRAKPRPITRQRYRSALARLEKIGLLERRGKLVFFFPQAPLGYFAQNNNNQKNAGQNPLSASAVKALKASLGKTSSDLKDVDCSVSKIEKSEDSNLLQAFDLLNLLTSPAAQSEGDAVEPSASQAKADAATPVDLEPVKFNMPMDWQPDRARLAAIAARMCVPLDGLTDEILGGFVTHWWAEETQKTQRQWELQLVRHLEHKHQYAEKKTKRAEVRASSATEPAVTADHSPSGVKPKLARSKPRGNVIPLRAGAKSPYQEAPNMETLSTASIENPALSVQTDELLAVLWQQLRGLYGWKFKSQFGEQPSSEWAMALANLDSQQIVAGLRNLIAAVDRSAASNEVIWPPSALEFRHLCLQIPGLPNAENAWFEALCGHYSHEAVQFAAKLTGLGALKNAKAGTLDYQQTRNLRGSFEMNFRLVKERLQRGEPLQGKQAAEREQEKQRQEAYNEYQRLKQIVEVGELPKADNALRQQAAQSRREAQALREQFNFEPLPDAPVIAASANVQSLRQGRAA